MTFGNIKYWPVDSGCGCTHTQKWDWNSAFNSYKLILVPWWCTVHANEKIKQLEARINELLTANSEITKQYRSSWLDELQEEQAKWQEENFPSKNDEITDFYGIVEELGEYAHAWLKNRQGIRGMDNERSEELQKDAIGDRLIYTLALCNHKGWKLSDIIRETWNKVVKKRNWKIDPINGRGLGV